MHTVHGVDGVTQSPRTQAACVRAQPAPARLELLDVAGRRLVEREVSSFGAGRHAVDLATGRTLSPGLYFVRLTHGADVRMTRVVVLK